MGPCLWGDAALELGLDAVVADGGGGVESVRDVRRGQGGYERASGAWVRCGGGVVGPYPGVTVRLQFETYRFALWALAVVADFGLGAE